MSNLSETPVGGPSSLTTIQRLVLRTAAIADAPCSLWFLGQVVTRSRAQPQPIDATVEELIDRGVLVDTAAGLRLTSTQLRDDVLKDTPMSLQRALRETAAEVLIDADRPAQAARQLLRAMPTVSQSAQAMVSRLVADPAVSPSLVADLLLAGLPPRAAEPHLAWLIDVADNLFLAGRMDETLALLHREIAADRYGPRQRAVLLGRLGACYATQRPALSLEYLNRALRQNLDVDGRSWTLAMLASLAARIGHPDVARLISEAERADEAGPTPGGAIRLALAHASRASAVGDLHGAARILRKADGGDPAARSQAVFLRVDRVANQISLGQYLDAASALETVTTEIDTLGPVAQPVLTVLDCVTRLATGELAEAEARARLALRESSRALPTDARIDLLAIVVEILLRRGEVTAARELLGQERHAADWPDAVQSFQLGCAAAGDPEPGRHSELLRTASRIPDRSMAPLLLVPHNGPRLVRAALLLGDRPQAEILTSHLKRAAGKVNNRLWRGVAHHVDGLMTGDPAALRAAVARLRTTSARPALADALFDLGRSPHVPWTPAIAALDECAALYARLGATGDHDRTRQYRDQLGDGGRSRIRVRVRYDGVAALTPAEARVAGLLASGATKQQAAAELFVSFHTVDTHLRAIYAKLGIRTRVQLARVWDARERQ